MPIAEDPNGYYDLLDVEPRATPEEIKAAFRSKAQLLHPDRNAAPDAKERFQELNQAFETLRDPDRRAKYDADGWTTFAEDESVDNFDLTPFLCSVCHKISAQPRYVIYRYVISIIFMTYRHVYQGVFCSKCGAKKAYKAALLTWLFGWWGFPWGPVYSVQALHRNILGGFQPVTNNFQLLGIQALYFKSVARMDIAAAIAFQAINLERQISSTQFAATPVLSEIARAIRPLLSVESPSSKRLPDVWGIRSTAFRIQMIPTVALVLMICLAGVIGTTRPAQPPFRHIPPTEPILLRPDEPAFTAPLIEPPSSGAIRKLWSTHPAPQLAPLKIVTADSGMSYYAKLIDLNTTKAALVVFVRAGETAVAKIPVGEYEFRYAVGHLWYGEEFLFGPETAYVKAESPLNFRVENDKAMGFVITLIKRADGNLTEKPLAAADF